MSCEQLLPRELVYVIAVLIAVVSIATSVFGLYKVLNPPLKTMLYINLAMTRH